jgi:hypothetical protein
MCEAGNFIASVMVVLIFIAMVSKLWDKEKGRGR